MYIRELRAEARECLKDGFIKAVLPVFYSTLIFYACDYIIMTVVNFISKLSVILYFISYLLAVVGLAYIGICLAYGVKIAMLKFARKEEFNYFPDAFSKGVRNMAMSAFWGQMLKVLPWIILAIVGNFIPIIGGLIALFSEVMVILEIYRCNFINYLRYDYRNKATKELLEKSRMLMHGNKAKAFVIPFTFAGWILLEVLVFFVISPLISFLWTPIAVIIVFFLASFVTTYLNMTLYQFYMEQKPLEIYNEDYVQPETNSKKNIYISIAIIIGSIIACACAYKLMFKI